MFVKNLISLIVIIYLIYSLVYSQSTDIKFEHISVEQGLSHPVVHCIFQDSKGYMWIGTEDGLNKFDGYTFTVYRPDQPDSTSLSHNDVRCIYEDFSGRLWIATLGGGINRFDRETEEFIRYTSASKRKTNIKSNYIRKMAGFMYQDKEIMWIGTSMGLDKFDPESKQFTHFLHTDKGYPYTYVEPVAVDSAGKVWIGCRKGGLHRFDPETGQFHSFSDDPYSPRSLNDDRVYSLLWDKSGILWISTLGGGLISYNPENNKFISYQMDPSDPQALTSDWISSIYEDRSGTLWLGTAYGGLNVLDRSTGEFTSYMHDPADPNSISDNTVMCTYEDRAGVFWVGTWDGLSRITPRKTLFTHIKPDPKDPNSLSGDAVWSMCESNYKGRPGLWIGTKTDGLNYLDLTSGKIERFRHDPADPNSIPSHSIFALCEDRSGTLWIGTYGDGLIRYNPRSNKFLQYKRDPADSASISGNIVLQIFEDSAGILWVGTRNSGLNLFDKTTNKFKWILRNLQITDLYEDKSGSLWIATPFGLRKRDPATGKITGYWHDPEDSSSISRNGVGEIHESREKDRTVFWLGSWGGLIRFDPELEIFKTYTTEHGLPSNIINEILEDDEGNLWISTNNGLSKFNPQNEKFRNYDVSDGLLENNIRGGCKTADGKMYFGSNKGVISFYPERLKDKLNIPEIVITDFQIFNKPVGIKKRELIQEQDQYFLDKHISEMQEIILSYRENIFSFEFAALDYTAPQKNRYAYKMKDVDPEWVYTDASRRFATYTNLDPGEYTFLVKGSNSDGTWNETGTAIHIIITPPWWQSQLAYIFYFIFFIALIVGTWRLQLRRIHLKQQMQMEHFEAQKLREVDQMKSRFFANISHEFRTPLTLIKGPVKQMLDGKFVGNLKDQYRMILRNSDRLLNLINQILDLSKLESREIKLKVVETDIIKYLKGIVFSFCSLAESKEVLLKFSSSENSVIGYADHDKLEKIVTNLLSNAFKFTPERGVVEVNLIPLPLASPLMNKGGIKGGSEGYIQLSISNKGPGIPADQLDKIFDRFYQADNKYKKDGEGTGIGLALTKDLVKVCHGEISVSSIPDRTTTFTVTLPIAKESFKDDEIFEKKEIGNGKSEIRIQVPEESIDEKVLQPNQTPTSGLPDKNVSLRSTNRDQILRDLATLLIVEDNPDVTQYISSFMANDYRILTAENGKEGLKKTIDKYPDLVISDVMMPDMDGFELCKKIKTDERTSHIPIILLTAKANMDSKIEGLEFGCDDYIIKPFDARELHVRIKNLIEQRKILREKFAQTIEIIPGEITTSSMDEQFLKRLLDVFETHIAESDFSTEDFAREVGMSRSNLHRKLQALTNQPTHEFLRSLRLKRAAQLLKKSTASVTEVAYAVGFNNLSHFTKIFRQQFGQTPSVFAKKNNN